MQNAVSSMLRREDSYYREERKELLEAVPPGTRLILDVGCGAGALGAALKARGAEVWGIECEPAPAHEASTRLDRLLQGDVGEVASQLPPAHFDALVLGDILEHLLDPWGALGLLSRSLAPGGLAVSTIPNVAHWRVLFNLLFRDAWRYAPSGTLDASHLRFFTGKTIREMFAGAGLRVERLEPAHPLGLVPRLMSAATFGGLRHILVWRYIVVARKPPASALGVVS